MEKNVMSLGDRYRNYLKEQETGNKSSVDGLSLGDSYRAYLAGKKKNSFYGGKMSPYLQTSMPKKLLESARTGKPVDPEYAIKEYVLVKNNDGTTEIISEEEKQPPISEQLGVDTSANGSKYILDPKNSKDVIMQKNANEVASKFKTAAEKDKEVKDSSEFVSNKLLPQGAQSVPGFVGENALTPTELVRKEIEDEYKKSEYESKMYAGVENVNERIRNKIKGYEDKYKNSSLEARKNAMIHSSDSSEVNWLSKHLYDNATSDELQGELDYYNNYYRELKDKRDKIANSLDNGDYLKLGYKNIVSAQKEIDNINEKLESNADVFRPIEKQIDIKKYEEKKQREYDDVLAENAEVKEILQRYYALQSFNETERTLGLTGKDISAITNEVTLADYNFINNLSYEERNNIKEEFENLGTLGYDKDVLYEYFKRDRDSEKNLEVHRGLSEYAEEHPVIGSIASVGARAVGAIPDAVKYLGAGFDKATGGDGYIDPDSTYTAMADTIRQTVGENINNPFGRFLYDTGMSMADFTVMLPLNAVPGGSALSMGILGTSAGVSSANEVMENGGRIDEAIATGFASGLAEAFFERFSLEQLKAFKKTGDKSFENIVKNILKGSFTEGSEEAFTDLANMVTDRMINADLSEFERNKASYIANGYSEAKAESAAWKDFLFQMGISFAGGALSGAVMNAGEASIIALDNGIRKAKVKNNARKSAIELGTDALASEGFDINALIEQGLKADKNSKAYKLANSIKKSIEKNGGVSKLSKGDVGNLMIAFDGITKTQQKVGKNKNTAVKTQQGTPTISELKDEIGRSDFKVEGSKPVFGKAYTKGTTAKFVTKGNAGQTVVIKSIEGSARTSVNTAENTVLLRTQDNEVIKADEVVFSDNKLETLVKNANMFDSYGAQNMVANYETWEEQQRENGKKPDIEEYIRGYDVIYNLGRNGVKYDTLQANAHYRATVKLMGNEIVKQALSTGARDVNNATNSLYNRVTKAVEDNGADVDRKADVYIENGTNAQLEPEILRVLQALAKKTGRDVIISDDFDSGNGKFANGRIILNSNVDNLKVLRTALHEAGHSIKSTNPKEWKALSDFVVNYLTKKGHNVERMIDNVITTYKNEGHPLQQTENETERDLALEEVVCNSLMSIAGDENALATAVDMDASMLEKIANALRKIAQKIKDWFNSLDGNYIKEIINDADILMELAERFSRAADNARSNIAYEGDSEFKNGEVVQEQRYSIERTTDNRPVVVIEDDILDGVAKKDWAKTVKNIMSTKFKDGIPIKGRLIKVNRVTRNEYVNSKYSRNSYRYKPVIYKDKLNSVNNLDEIIIASTNYVNEDLKHVRKDNFKEFARGDVLLRIGSNDYSAKVIVGFTTGNNMVLYDIIDFKSADLKIKKVDMHTAQQQNKKAESYRTGISTEDNIPQPDAESQEKFSFGGEFEKGEVVRFSFNDDVIDSFNIPQNKMFDSIYVQRNVFNTLMNEGFFTDDGGRSRTVVNKESGMAIEINKSGIKETFSYTNYSLNNINLKLEKLATVRYLPEIIENGKLIADEVGSIHSKQKGIKFAYIHGEAVINNNKKIVKIGVKKSEQKNKFWVHYILTEENTEISSDESKNAFGSAANYLGVSGESIPHPNTESQEKFSFGGELSNTKDISLLDKAKNMENEGVSSEEIRQETGWFKSYDGKWRYEIDDSKMKFKGLSDTDIEKAFQKVSVERRMKELEKKVADNTATKAEEDEYYNLDEKIMELQKSDTLEDYIKHPELFEAYPQLKNTKVAAVYGENYRGNYNSATNTISLNVLLNYEEAKETIVHEVEHAIQKIESFAGGSNVEYWESKSSDNPYGDYRKTAGEIEARDSQRRLDYTAEQRKNIRPDIDRTDIVFADGGVSFSVKDKTLDEYSEQQIRNWSNSKNIVIYKDEDQLREFILNALKGKDLNKKIYFGIITEEISNKIYKETGIILKNFNLTLRASEIRKIINKSHGDENLEMLRGQRAVMAEDLLLIPTIITNPDSIKLSEKTFENKPVIQFIKTLHGKTTVVAYVSQKHYDLTVQTMYSGIKEKSLATTLSEDNFLSQTSETLSGTASDDRISQSNNPVNSQYMQEDENNSNDVQENISDIRYAIDDDYSGWLDEPDAENSSEAALALVYRKAAKTAKEGLTLGGGISLTDAAMHKVASKVMKDYSIDRKLNPDFAEEFIDDIKLFVRGVQDGKGDFVDLFDEFVTNCKDSLRSSVAVDELALKEERDFVKGLTFRQTLLIPEYMESEIAARYGSVAKFRQHMMGKTFVARESGRDKSKSGGYYVEDVIEAVRENFPYLIDDSVSGIEWLDNLLNNVLAPKYVNHYVDGMYESLDVAAVEMAFDCVSEYIHQQGLQYTKDKKADKKKIKELNSLWEASATEREKLLQTKLDLSRKIMKEDVNEQQQKYLDLKDKVKKKALASRAFTADIREMYWEARNKAQYISAIKRLYVRTSKKYFTPKPTQFVPQNVAEQFAMVMRLMTEPEMSSNTNVLSEIKKLQVQWQEFAKNKVGAEFDNEFYSLIAEKKNLSVANEDRINDQLTSLYKFWRERNVKSLKEISSEEVKTVYEIFQRLEKEIAFNQKIVIKGKEYNAFDISRKIVKEFEDVLGTSLQGDTMLDYVSHNTRRGFSLFLNQINNPEQFAKRTVNWKEDSLFVELFKNLNEGENNAHNLKEKWENECNAVFEKYRGKELRSYKHDSAYDIGGIEITRDMMVEMVLEYEDKYGKAHIINQGYLIPNLKYVKKNNKSRMYEKDSGVKYLKYNGDTYDETLEYWDNLISDIRKEVMKDSLSRDVYNLCKKLYQTEMQKAVNEVSLKKYGYEVATVKNYCPITVDEDVVEKNFADVLINRSINSRSFLHQRPTGGNRLKLMGALDKLGKHIDGVSSWCGLTIPIETFSKVYNMTAFDNKMSYSGKKLEIIDGLAKNQNVEEERQFSVEGYGNQDRYAFDDINYQAKNKSYENIDLSTLDDEELRVYNKREWANELFTGEDRNLLNEKFNELNSRTGQRTDNVLGDGSRVVEVNNKIVLIGGTFEKPEIYCVLAINADNETEAESLKEWILYDSEEHKQNKSTYINNCELYESIVGKESVRTYNSNDFRYNKGRKDTGKRALLPSAFKNYGYTKQFQNRGGNRTEIERDFLDEISQDRYSIDAAEYGVSAESKGDLLNGYSRYSNDVEYGEEPIFKGGTENYRALHETYSRRDRGIREKTPGIIQESRGTVLLSDDTKSVIDENGYADDAKNGVSTDSKGILHFPSVKEVLKSKWGDSADKYISKLMGDLQGANKAETSTLDVLTSNYMSAVLTANLRASIKQLCSYPLAAAVTGWKSVVRGLKHIRPGKHTPGLNRILPEKYLENVPFKELEKYTSVLWYRQQGNNSRDLQEVNKYKGLGDADGFVNQVRDKLNWLEKVDNLMISMNYWIAYEYVKNDLHIDPNSKEFMPEIAKTLEKIIKTMMPNASVMQQCQMLRSKNSLVKVFTLCKSQVLCVGSNLADAHGEYCARHEEYKKACESEDKGKIDEAHEKLQKSRSRYVNSATAAIASSAMMALLKQVLCLVFAQWDSDRDEDGIVTPKAIGERMLWDFVGDLFGNFLFGEEIAGFLISTLTNERYYGLGVVSIDSINELANDFLKVMQGKADINMVLDIAGDIGKLTGLPVENLIKLGESCVRHFKNCVFYGFTPAVGDNMEVDFDTYAATCYNALIDGDNEKYETYKNMWLKETKQNSEPVDEEYINSRIRSELVDNEEIVAAGEALLSGNLESYESVVKKYVGSGFDEEMVISAVNSVADSFEEDKEIEKSKETKIDETDRTEIKYGEMYGYSDLFDALKNGNTKNYDRIYNYLITEGNKEPKEIKSAMRSASRTDKMFEELIVATKNNDKQTVVELREQLTRIYGSSSEVSAALAKYQKKQKEKEDEYNKWLRKKTK